VAVAAVTTSSSPSVLDSLPRRQVPRALILLGIPDNNQAFWRARWPAEQLTRRGYVVDWTTYEALERMQYLIASGRYNVVVTPRFTFTSPDAAHMWQRNLEQDSLTWIYEADDDIWSEEIVEHQLRLFAQAREVGKARLEWERQERIRMLRACDGVTVSNDALAFVVRRFTHKPVKVVPNVISVEWFRAMLQGQSRTIAPLTVGWSGGARDGADLEMVAEAWANLARRFPDMRFVVQGDPHARTLRDAVPEDRLVYLPWVGVAEHPATLLNVDIACCSVADNGWNRCKSPNKWAEFSLAGAACVVSNTLYGAVVEDAHTALIAESAAEWEESIARLAQDANLRRTINLGAQRAIEREHSIEQTWWRWMWAWAQLLEFNPCS
jgi:glycosyltransferase involved in cell wall biosynthesis